MATRLSAVADEHRVRRQRIAGHCSAVVTSLVVGGKKNRGAPWVYRKDVVQRLAHQPEEEEPKASLPDKWLAVCRNDRWQRADIGWTQRTSFLRRLFLEPFFLPIAGKHEAAGKLRRVPGKPRNPSRKPLLEARPQLP